MLRFTLFGLALLIVLIVSFRGIAQGARAHRADKVSGAIALFNSR